MKGREIVKKEGKERKQKREIEKKGRKQRRTNEISLGRRSPGRPFSRNDQIEQTQLPRELEKGGMEASRNLRLDFFL